jgi:glycosyltransferase involved in cell wall biosynthesis
LVLPTYAEGFPTVITEAMSAGLPIITTGIRGAADRLEDGTNALFVRPRDSVGLFKAMERLLQDGALRSMMSEANIERVRVFSPDVVGQEYVSTLLAISR